MDKQNLDLIKALHKAYEAQGIMIEDINKTIEMDPLMLEIIGKEIVSIVNVMLLIQRLYIKMCERVKAEVKRRDDEPVEP